MCHPATLQRVPVGGLISQTRASRRPARGPRVPPSSPVGRCACEKKSARPVDWLGRQTCPTLKCLCDGARRGAAQGKNASYSNEGACSGKDTAGTKARHAGFAWKALQRPQSAGRFILGRLFGLRGAARPRTWRYAITHGMKNKVYRIIPGSPVAHVPC